ncbi:MAG: acyl-CoA dehydrogenase, partial [Gammaproteobacteria bacterium]
HAYANARLIRIADGPDEVHRAQLARLELKDYDGTPSIHGGNAHVPPLDLGGFIDKPLLIV